MLFFSSRKLFSILYSYLEKQMSHNVEKLQ